MTALTSDNGQVQTSACLDNHFVCNSIAWNVTDVEGAAGRKQAGNGGEEEEGEFRLGEGRRGGERRDEQRG